VLEVEMKFESPGNDKVVEALKGMGARPLFDGVMEDIYFSHPSRDFGSTDEAVRLRTCGADTEITYKGPRIMTSSTKAREELTVTVSDSLSIRRMLERLGFSEFMSIRKKRSSFLLDKLRVDVDEVEGLGQFVELELVTEDPSKAEALMALARNELALREQISETYLEMLLTMKGGLGRG
jgi:adenylate cyclase class 2